MTFTALLLIISAFFSGCKKSEPLIPLKSESNSKAFKLTSLLSDSTAINYSLVNSPYVAGADITTLLQNEVDSAKEIIIPQGLYYISKAITKNGGTINIKGYGAVLQMVSTFPSGKKTLSAGIELNGLTNVSIEGITIDGNRENLVNAGTNWTNYIMGIEIYSSSNIQLKNCSVINGPSISFNIKASMNVELVDCSSTNGMFHGAVFEYCNNVNVSGLTVIGIGNQGFDNRKGGIGLLGIGGAHLTFTNNYIENSADTGTKTEGSTDVTWDGNVIKNCGKDGIKFQNLVAGENQGQQPTATFATNAKIINNTVEKIYNGRKDGSSLIQVWNAHNVEVRNNTITGGTKTGQEDGICVWSNTETPAENIVIVGNVIKNTNRFIYLNNVNNATINDNSCENLVAPKSKFDGLAVEFSDRIEVANNLFRRSATGAIDGFAAKMYQTSNFILQNNQLENAYNALALRLASCDTASIIGNQMSNFSSYAMFIYGGNLGTTLNALKMTDNQISKVGTATGYSAVIKVDPENITINKLDLSNTAIVGNASFGDVALEIKSSTKKVNTLNLTGFSVSGNVSFPAPVDLTACQTVVN